MAVTNFHTIHKGTYNAVAYIINPDKTADGRYVISNLCVSSAAGAAEQFRETREYAGTGKCRNEAQHIIQAFQPGEVTPEQALLIGQELCKELFDNQYQYVLATHADKDHIHNHIIINNVNFFTGKTFETEFNQGKTAERAWIKLREASDNLCAKHNLSVIQNASMTNGKNHFEWEQNKQGLSWKAKLKYAIDQVVKESDDFTDFLKKCADFGVLAEYNPEHVIDLKFMLEEQKKNNPKAKFTRAKTLGWYYESKQISRRIEQYRKCMSFVPKYSIINTDSDRFKQSQGLANWANLENMKTASRAINEMTADNSTLEELETAAHNAFAQRMAAVEALKPVQERWNEIEDILPVIEKFAQYKPFSIQYRSLNGRAQKKYAREHIYELSEFERVFSEIRKRFPDKKVPTVKMLTKEKEELQKLYEEKNTEYITAKKEADRLSRLIQNKQQSQKALEQYLQNEQAAKQKKKQSLE